MSMPWLWWGVVDQLVRWYMVGFFRPRTDEADWCRRIFREHNKVADTHANWMMDNGDSGPGAQRETRELCEKLQKYEQDGVAAWVRQPGYGGCVTGLNRSKK